MVDNLKKSKTGRNFELAEIEGKIFKTDRNKKCCDQNQPKRNILKLAEILAKYFKTDRNEIY